MDRFGPDNFSTLQIKGHVLHRARAHLKVPAWLLVWNALLTKKLPMFLSRLNEISGGCEKILPGSGSFWSNLKFFRMMDLTAWLWGWMEFDYCSPSETFVVLTADQFVGRDDGLLEQQKQDSQVCRRNAYMGPSYANLFVGYIEHKFFSQYNGPKPELYRRYIDDCVGATSSTREELNQFVTAVNSFHPTLKYTWEISDTSLAFLDIKLSIEGNGLCTSVHYKPTYSHSYLLYSSGHIHHMSRILFLILYEGLSPP